MAVIEAIAGAGASFVGGGVLGIFGTVFGRVASFFERKQAFEQEQARWKNDREEEKHELALLNLRDVHDENRAEREIKLAATEGSWRGLEASQAAQTALVKHEKGSARIIDVLRLVRPVLTILLWLITAWIFGVTKDAAIVEAAIFAATAATLWWFGDRAPKPPAYYMTGNK